MLKVISALGVAGALSLSAPLLAEPTKENTLAIKGQFEFASLDPTRRGYVFQRMQVLETLVNVDAKGNLTPGLASKWEISEDGKAWTFTLQPDVKFHNGSALDATAVVNSLNIARAKPSLMQGAPITGIEVLDPQKMRVNLANPYSPLGAIMANYSTAILAPEAFDAESNVIAVIGTGAFTAYEIAMPHKLVVERFDDYWGKKASIEYASYLTGHRAESRVLQVRSGEGDIVFGLDAASVPALRMLPQVEILRTDLPRVLSIKLNLAHPLLASQSSREALSLAINRHGIASAVLRSPESATAQLLPSYMSDWHIGDTSAAQDLERAQSLLMADGWQKNSDGWMEKAGQPFELTLITYADRPELVTVATALQDQWKRIGVKLNVNVTNSSAIPSGHQDGSLEVALIARNYGTIADPLGVLIKDFGNSSGGDWGSMNWSQPAIQASLSQLVQQNDTAKYRQQAQQIAQAIYEDKPLIAIAHYVQHTAVQKDVEGFRFDPYERSYFLNEIKWNR
ncbi:ABC transporter substrate-binding protein [Aliamphritea spongicola]|uniref:ABC transporter substrate-binding protein n=1 Tax=Aliamphritea spongicola TaxID=707589 RepID=UPI00196A7D54|nr:ABC transporter substrate-binding protein [Aliamphritea spongicola]MBN3561465.1 ABC transporter substrate-binding protein [Aliamphritea spongicola]